MGSSPLGARWMSDQWRSAVSWKWCRRWRTREGPSSTTRVLAGSSSKKSPSLFSALSHSSLGPMMRRPGSRSPRFRPCAAASAGWRGRTGGSVRSRRRTCPGARGGRRRGVDVDDRAADGELAGAFHQRLALEAHGDQRLGEAFQVEPLAPTRCAPTGAGAPGVAARAWSGRRSARRSAGVVSGFAGRQCTRRVRARWRAAMMWRTGSACSKGSVS